MMKKKIPSGERIRLSQIAEDSGMKPEDFFDEVMECFGAQILAQIERTRNNPVVMELDYEEGKVLVVSHFIPADNVKPPGEPIQ